MINECRSLVLDLMSLNEEYDVLFIPGGSSSQFHMIPMNLLGTKDKALYIINGIWSHLAQIVGQIDTIMADNFTQIVDTKQLNINQSKYKYIYVTSNTCYGTQYPKECYPEVDHNNCFLITDIMSRDMDYTKFDVIHASIQKNLGITGITMVIIRKSLIKIETKHFHQC